MVQRRHRQEKPPPAFTVNTRKIYRISVGIIGVILAIWLIFVVIPGIFSGDEHKEEIATPSAIVEVLNGTRITGIAGQMTEFLRETEIDSLIAGNADNTNYIETIIIEHDSVGHYAAQLSELTGIKNITYDYITESAVDVTIILGKDYPKFKPFNQ